MAAAVFARHHDCLEVGKRYQLCIHSCSVLPGPFSFPNPYAWTSLVLYISFLFKATSEDYNQQFKEITVYLIHVLCILFVGRATFLKIQSFFLFDSDFVFLFILQSPATSKLLFFLVRKHSLENVYQNFY